MSSFASVLNASDSSSSSSLHVRSTNNNNENISMPIISTGSTIAPALGRTSANKRTWTICLFSITTLLLFADQNLMAPNLSDMADEFGFDDEERDRKLGGDIALAFFLLGAPASMVIGCLTDSSDRSVVFAWTVFIGEGACFLTYWVQNYPQLYVCRAITGFSVGGAVPLIYSILGDLFAAEDRHVVSALVSFGTGAGIAVGQAVAGFFGPVYGWRLPFLIVSIPALLLAMLVLFTVPDPERGGMETGSHIKCREDQGGEDGVALVPIQNPKQGAYQLKSTQQEHTDSSTCSISTKEDQHTRARGTTTVIETYFDGMFEEQYGGPFGPEVRMHLHTMARLLTTPTVVLAVVQGAPGCITWGVINVFLNDFLSEDRGFSVQMATTTLMFFSVGNGLGLFILGGGLGQRLYRQDKRHPAILAGASAIMGCVPLWMLFNKVDVDTTYWKVILVSVLAGFGSGPTGPIIKATLTNVTNPRSRGQAFAFFNLFDDFGKGLGPFFVSLLISGMGGRLPAFNFSILGWLICGVANLAIFWFVEDDEASMQSELSLSTRSRDLSI